MFIFPSCFYIALHIYKKEKKQKPQKRYTLFKHLGSTGTTDLSSSFNSSFLITLEFSLVIACLLDFALLTSLTGGIKYQVLPFHRLITTHSVISVSVRSDEVMLKVIFSIQFASKPHETLLLLLKCLLIDSKLGKLYRHLHKNETFLVHLPKLHGKEKHGCTVCDDSRTGFLTTLR